MTKFRIPSINFSSEFQKIFANAGWLLADRILRMGIGLFVFTQVARYLGADQLGVYSFASAFVGLFSTIAAMGLPGLAVKTLTDKPECKDKILGTVFCLQLLGGILSLVLSVLAVLFLRYQDTVTINIVAILASGAIFQAFDTIDIWYQSQTCSKYTVIAKNIAFIIFALIKIYLIKINASLFAFAFAALGEVVTASIGLVLSYSLLGNSLLRWRWKFSISRKLLQQSWPLILSGFTVMIYMKIDQIMLGEMLGDNAVGIYSVATRISEVWYFIPTVIVSSMAPSIYQARRDGNYSLYYSKISKTIKFLNLIAVAIAVPMTFLSRPLIFLLFGKNFEESAIILSIHIWSAFFIFMLVGTSVWFIGEGLTNFALYRNSVGVVVNILINLALIPLYQGMGAAIATLISYAVSGFFFHGILKRTRKIFYIQFNAIFLNIK